VDADDPKNPYLLHFNELDDAWLMVKCDNCGMPLGNHSLDDVGFVDERIFELPTRGERTDVFRMRGKWWASFCKDGFFSKAIQEVRETKKGVVTSEGKARRLKRTQW
jgi:hypothetical protein